MNNAFFWNSWKKSHRILYSCFLLLLLSAATLYFYSEYFSKNTGLSWEIVSEVKTQNFIVDQFQKGFFRFSVEGESQYFVQAYEGSLHNSPSWCSYLLVAAISLLLISGCVTISYVKSWWYFAGLTLIGLYFYFLNLDVLEVFGVANKYWTIGCFLVYGVLIHVFHDFKPFTPVLLRYFYFTVLTAVTGFVTLHYSNHAEPILHLAAYAWFAPFGLALAYAVIVSTDIPAGFLYLATGTKNVKKSSSLLNFLLVTLFFLGNVTLTFLKNRGSINWNIYYLNAPLLVFGALVLGIWAFKKKEPVYEKTADFSPATAIWHLVLGINFLLFFSFANITANDPLQEVMEDAVIFSHLAMGIMFVLYVVANFMGMMEQNLPAHMVLYKPRYMPFAFVRLMGLIGILSIVLYNSNYQYRQTLAAAYIMKAEVFIHEENYLLAEEYLNNALGSDAGNHKGNYLLAMILRTRNKDNILAKGLLKQAMFKNPAPQTYASLGNYFLEEGDIIRSLETLREGKNKFPSSKEILNNLALAFARTDIADSTLFYLSQSAKRNKKDPVASSNQLAFALENGINPETDESNFSNDLTYSINLLAVNNTYNKIYSFPADTSLLSDTALTIQEAAYVNNLALNNLSSAQAFPVYRIDSLLQSPSNNNYYENLLFAKAFRQYYSGRISEGILTMDQLQANSSRLVRINNILATWLIQQDAPQVAMDFLSKAKEAGDLNASFGMAIATSFYLPYNESIRYWRDPAIFTDSVFRNISIALQTKGFNSITAGILPQAFKADGELAASYRKLPQGADKDKAAVRIMKYLNDHNLASDAILIYQSSAKSDDITLEYVRALKIINDKRALKLTLLILKDNSVANYYKAWLIKDKNKEEAIRLYKKALESGPLYEEGVLEAIRFLQSHISKEEIYDYLLTSVMLNQYSAAIQKAYILQCVETNNFNFADYSLKKVESLMDKKEFDSFAKAVSLRKEKRLSEIEWK